MERKASERAEMELQAAMKRLQEATIKGNIPSLLQLLSEHPHILDIERYYFKQSTLNVALKLGHLDFANKILLQKPELAEDLIIDHSSSSLSSPLHISSEKGYLEMVRTLLKNSSASSMSLAHDSDGRNPVHLAAIRGHQEVLRALLEAMPMAAREHTAQSHGGETVLHLCVKYRQLESLAFLIDQMNVGDLLNSTDNHGNTVLHLAVSSKQPQMVEYLVKKKGIKKNAMNTNGLTSMDICTKSSKDKKHEDIWKTLKLVKALSSKDLLKKEEPLSWLSNQRNALMVVASLIATMAFQFGVNPPGGVWQDNKKDDHVAGESVLGYQKKDYYHRLLITNSIGFISSLCVILLLISGLPCRRFFMVILMITMWIAIVSTAFSYSISLSALAKSMKNNFETPPPPAPATPPASTTPAAAPLAPTPEETPTAKPAKTSAESRAPGFMILFWSIIMVFPFVLIICYLVKLVKRKGCTLKYFFTRRSTTSIVV